MGSLGDIDAIKQQRLNPNAMAYTPSNDQAQIDRYGVLHYQGRLYVPLPGALQAALKGSSIAPSVEVRQIPAQNDSPNGIASKGLTTSSLTTPVSIAPAATAHGNKKASFTPSDFDAFEFSMSSLISGPEADAKTPLRPTSKHNVATPGIPFNKSLAELANGSPNVYISAHLNPDSSASFQEHTIATTPLSPIKEVKEPSNKTIKIPLDVLLQTRPVIKEEPSPEVVEAAKAIDEAMATGEKNNVGSPATKPHIRMILAGIKQKENVKPAVTKSIDDILDAISAVAKVTERIDEGLTAKVAVVKVANPVDGALTGVGPDGGCKICHDKSHLTEKCFWAQKFG